MKLLLLFSVGLLLLATTALGQEEVTTTLAPPVSPDAPKEGSTEAPAAAAETTTVPVEAAKTETPSESAATEEKPKTEEKKDETDGKGEEAKQPGEQEAPTGPPQEPPKFVFVTQHFRDPLTGVVYSRQVPLIPSTYLRPLPSQSEVRQQPPPQAEGAPAQPQLSFDPLGQFSEQQKKRQFYQDMIMTQLTRFEKEIEPMLDSEQNVTQKNDMEELLSTVADLKQKLENHQLFNISEIMNNWKQGKLADGQTELPPPPPTSEPPRGPPVGVLSPPPQVAYSRQPQMTLRTVILVPQTRHQQQPQQQPPPMQPQYQQQYNPYAAMTRQVPVIHIRRSPYQAAMFASVPEPGRQTERAEPQQGTGGEGEYSNTNDIYGY